MLTKNLLENNKQTDTLLDFFDSKKIPNTKKTLSTNKIKFIDLFSGIGGTRIGFSQACAELGYGSQCIFTSEIKDSAIKTYLENFEESTICGDIREIEPKNIKDFDYLLAGFPCQPFSSAGKRLGFVDTRGTLFFEIEKIIKAKEPKGFLLENVEGLATHNNGKTLDIIINNLEKLGYQVSYSIIDSSEHGVPQKRRRTYILGRKDRKINLSNLNRSFNKLKNILEKDKNLINTNFTRKLLSQYKPEDLLGKSIKDKRGGDNNIHSWDIEIKGIVSDTQKKILNLLFKERRKKHWAIKKEIDWMDGMPLTLLEIESFVNSKLPKGATLEKLLNDLVQKGYLRFEYPKKLVEVSLNNKIIKKRVYDETKEKGYNIVTGKLSFEINKILDPEDVAPTIVATDANKLAVVDGAGLRKLTIKEGLRLFGFPEWYEIKRSHSEAFDLLGNTVTVPVIRKLVKKLID